MKTFTVIINNLMSGLFAVLISGCGVSAFTNRDINPVVKDDTINTNWLGIALDQQAFTTHSTTASRRVVLVLQDKNNAEPGASLSKE